MLFECPFLIVIVQTFVFCHYDIYIRSEKSLPVVIQSGEEAIPFKSNAEKLQVVIELRSRKKAQFYVAK